MNIGSQSISNQSEGFGDYRYHKALKQISKLINVNRQIKLQSERYRQLNQQLHNSLSTLTNEHQHLLQAHTHLEQNMQLLSHEYEKLSQEYVGLEEYCRKMEYQKGKDDSLAAKKDKQQYQQICYEKHLEEIEQITQRFRLQMDEIIQELRMKEGVIQQLEGKVDLGNHYQGENILLKQNYDLLVGQNRQLKKQLQQLTQQLSSHIKSKPTPQHDQELLNKLKINQQWIKSLNQQNYNLKQKLLQQQYKKQKQKCNQTIFSNLVKNTQAQLITHLPTTTNTSSELFMKEYYSRQFGKKIKKMQEEKAKYQLKYSRLKSKNHQLQLKATTLQKQVNLLINKANRYQQLTQKQQRQIEHMIDQYHKQMDKVIFCQNNKKLTPVQQEYISDRENHHHRAKQQQQNELSDLIKKLKSELKVKSNLLQQKEKLIKYLQDKISTLSQQCAQIIQVNNELQQELSSYQDMDLNKTSKNYTKHDSLIKTQSLTKNGNKVFVINGKKYETVALKNGNLTKQQRKEQD